MYKGFPCLVELFVMPLAFEGKSTPMQAAVHWLSCVTMVDDVHV